MTSGFMRRGAAGAVVAGALLASFITSSGAIAATPHARAAASAHVVKITANPYGQLKYTQSSLKTTPGKVTIDFTNKSPMQHDVVLINSKNKILGQTPIFSGGTKSFTVTLTAGMYIYYCSVPGHREAGMQGTLTVS